MTRHKDLPEWVDSDMEIGIGTWSWGDRLFWQYGQSHSGRDVHEAYMAALDAGVRFFDTAEVYGMGRSERLLGQLISATDAPVWVATKFMPWPWRLTRSSLLAALRKSLDRLRLHSVDLYQVHQPYSPISVETWMAAMADAVEAGLTRTVGVSNYSRQGMEQAHQALSRRGVALAANQVSYSLLDRTPEFNGVRQACADMDVRLIAYSPLGQGILTGKYTPDSPLPGLRGLRYGRQRLERAQPLVALLRKFGEVHDKTPAQVSLNWLICKGALPIPGAKNACQARENAAAAGWRLTEDEVAQLDYESEKLR